MHRTAMALAAVLLLAGCGGGEEQDTSADPTSSSTSTAATTTASSAAEDVAAQDNCVLAGLTYSPIRSGLNGDLDLEGTLRYAEAIDLDPATTQPGKDANLALAELGFQITLAQAQVLSGGEVDRGALQAAYTAAQEACAAIGGGL